jgi:hypothetical protein
LQTLPSIRSGEISVSVPSLPSDMSGCTGPPQLWEIWPNRPQDLDGAISPRTVFNEVHLSRKDVWLDLDVDWDELKQCFKGLQAIPMEEMMRVSALCLQGQDMDRQSRAAVTYFSWRGARHPGPPCDHCGRNTSGWTCDDHTRQPLCQCCWEKNWPCRRCLEDGTYKAPSS